MCYSLVPYLNHYYVCACELRFKEDSKRKSNHVTFSCDAEDKVTVTEIFKMLFYVLLLMVLSVGYRLGLLRLCILLVFEKGVGAVL